LSEKALALAYQVVGVRHASLPVKLVCRHSMAPDAVKRAHDAAFKALNEAYQALMDGALLCV
jgi:hypothetical protein